MSGARIVLLHSSGLSGRQWRRLEAELSARGERVVAPDLTGHGSSEPWPEPRPFSFRRDVERVASMLEADGPAHIVGHSYGGLVGLLAALTAPCFARSMALFEPVAFGVLDVERDADVLAELRKDVLRWDDPERWLGTFTDYWGGPGAWAALREEVRAEMRRVGWVMSEGVRSLVADRTPASAYRALQTPTVLLHGETSPLAARRVVERLAESLPRARTVAIAGAGHMAPLTHAEVLNRAILDAITRES
jgi:pimeloyl-ACP methyl ester carboxylesterase